MRKTVNAMKVVETFQINGKARIFILIALLAVLGLAFFSSPLSELILSVLHRVDASHGMCVPFISAYLIWLRSGKIRELEPKLTLLPGTGVVGCALLLFFLAGESTGIILPVLSFLLAVGGLILGLFGKEIFKQVAFPLFFLATMIPLPEPLYDQLTQWMRTATTSGSVGLLQLSQFPIYREGYTVSIPGMELLVNNSCSGIRYLIPYFVFGLAYAYVTRRTIRARVLVVLATIPMAIFAGILRQSFIFLSAHYIGPFMAGHQPHVMISWMVFMTALLVVMWGDRKAHSVWRRGSFDRLRGGGLMKAEKEDEKERKRKRQKRIENG